MPTESGSLILSHETFRQLFRYGVVGVGVNLLLYLGYLSATALGIGHKMSMTIFYAIGVALSFALNRNWSFAHSGQVSRSFIRYLLTYLGGYILNLFLLWWLVDRVGWPHAAVQGVLIFAIAGCIFLTQKLWVFARD